MLSKQQCEYKSKVSSILLGLLWVCCLMQAFDFKGDAGSGAYQIVSYVLTVLFLGAIICLLILRPINYPAKKIQLVSYFLFLFLGSTVFVAYIQNVPFGNYRVVFAPYFLMGMSYLATSAMCRRYGIGIVEVGVFPAIKVLFLISFIWTIYIGFSSADSSILTVRYKVISTLLPFGVAYLISAAASNMLTMWGRILLGIVIVVLVIGQTRSIFIVVLIAFLSVTYGHSQHLGQWLQSMSRVIFYLVLSVLVAYFFLEFFSHTFLTSGETSFFLLWQSRIFGSASDYGFDVTSAARLGEYDNQMTKLFSSGFNSLIGLGLGAPYTYSGIYADLVADVVGIDEIPIDYWNGGHSLFVYTLYANGVIVGGVFIFLIIFSLKKALNILKICGKIESNEARHRVVSIVAGYICLLSTGLTGFPLGSRSIAFLVGIMLAFVVGYDCKVRRPFV